MQRKSCPKMITVLAILMTALAFVPGAWANPKYKVLYNFQGGKDGSGPMGGLILDAAGNLYGVTGGGGVGSCSGGCGTVFELSRTKGRWAKKTLYRFRGNPTDGFAPEAKLAFDANGNLYGTTYSGGGQGDCSGLACGIVFELTPSAGGRWKETVLHRFAGGSDGAIPYAGVLLDAVGNAYGTTTHGGGAPCDCGTVFELLPVAGGSWSEQILHTFSGPDGGAPFYMTFDAAGSLYGVTGYDGQNDAGVAFELTPGSGGTWNDTTLYSFQGAPDGALPDYGVAFDGENLYGVTDAGGRGHGTVFELKPDAKGGWTESVIHTFTGGKDGRNAEGSLAFDASGDIYGSTGGDVSCLHGDRLGCGNVFELIPASGQQWKLRVLHTFTGGSHPAYPSGLISDTQGNLFGDAGQGGTGKCNGGGWSGCGVVFEITP